MSESVENLKKMGAEFYAHKQFEKSLECYDKALKVEPNNAIIYSNRAAVYLALNKPEIALQDATRGLELDNGNSAKLRYRKAKALYELKSYQNCFEFIRKECLQKFPEIIELSSKCSNMLSFDRELVIEAYLSAKAIQKSSQGSVVEALAFAMSEERSSKADAPNKDASAVDVTLRQSIVSLSDIILHGKNHVSKGKFLLCRTLFESYCCLGNLCFLVEDPECNFVVRLHVESAEEKTLSAGTILAVMHPWLNQDANGYAKLWCSNPKHFVVLDSSKYCDIKWQKELVEESQLTKKTEEVESNAWRIYEECAFRYYAIGKIEKALEFAERGLELQPLGADLISAKATSLFALRRYQDCIDFLTPIAEEFPNVPEFVQLIENSKLLLNEQLKGEYPIALMYAEADDDPHLGHAEFFNGEKIKTEESGILRAKLDLAPGTLLIAEKAIAFVYPDIPVELDDGTFDKYGRDPVRLLPVLVKRIRDFPDVGHELFKLVYGNVDFDENSPLDLDRIREIIRATATVLCHDVDDFSAAAIWLKSAQIKESCVEANCFRHIIGDFSFIRVVKPIRNGELLLLAPTCAAFEPLEIRQNYFEQRKSKCDCRWCKAEACLADDVRKQIKLIRNTIDKAFVNLLGGSIKQKLKEIRALGDKANSLAIEPSSLNILALKISSKIGLLLIKDENYAEAIQIQSQHFEAFFAAGMFTEAHEEAYSVEHCYRKLGDAENAEKWRVKGEGLMKLLIGDPNMMAKFIESRLKM